MISVINYTGRFLFTALFVIINNFLKRCHHLIHHFFLKKKRTFNKRNYTSPLLNHIKGNTSSFGSAIQVLPSDIRKYFSSFQLDYCCCGCFYLLLKIVFFMDVNSYVEKKVDLNLNLCTVPVNGISSQFFNNVVETTTRKVTKIVYQGSCHSIYSMGLLL